VKTPFRILCAVDASRPGAAAFEQALAMSVQRGAQLVVVHAVSKHNAYSWGALERDAALAALRQRAEALNIPVRVRVQQGDTAEVILLHARAQDPDLIVLGSHEPVGLTRFRFRSIADRVVKGAMCPVLLVPPATTHVQPTFRSVVCAIDLSSRSTAAVANTARFVGNVGQLTLLHVLRNSVPRRYAPFASPEFSRAMARDARQRLHSIVDMQEPHSDVLVTVSSNAVHDEILRIAVERKADLIVVGATRRAGLRRRFFGTTALRVSRRSPVPVLVLPAVHVKRDLSTADEAALGWVA
jgi:nucleotide-binding universal stress UspA family protein